MFVLIEQQCACQRIDDLGGGLYVPALLEPGVPSDADSGQVGDLFAPKAGSSTSTESAVLRQPDV